MSSFTFTYLMVLVAVCLVGQSSAEDAKAEDKLSNILRTSGKSKRTFLPALAAAAPAYPAVGLAAAAAYPAVGVAAAYPAAVAYHPAPAVYHPAPAVYHPAPAAYHYGAYAGVHYPAVAGAHYPAYPVYHHSCPPSPFGGYLPNPANPCSFFQCSNGVPVFKPCPVGQKWVQPLATCVPLHYGEHCPALPAVVAPVPHVAPVVPVPHVAPVAPVVPVAPAPVAPVVPVAPAPVAPVAPVRVAPVAPVAHVAPVLPSVPLVQTAGAPNMLIMSKKSVDKQEQKQEKEQEQKQV